MHLRRSVAGIEHRQFLVPCTHGPADLDMAFCLDAPCSVEKGTVSCQCQLNPASDYYTFINVCPVDGTSLRAACAEIWSAASQAELLSGFWQLTPFYGNPPKLAYCPANTAGSPAAR